MSSSNCCFLTCIQESQEAGKVVRYSHIFKNFPQFVMIHTVKDFSVLNEVDFFSGILLLFLWSPMNTGNLISGSSDFSKSSLNIWKFSVHVLLKPSLVNFEHYFANMWNECNCVVVRGNRQEGQGSSNRGKRLQVKDIFISLKWQEETNQRYVFPSLYKFKRRFLLTCCVAMTPGLT